MRYNKHIERTKRLHRVVQPQFGDLYCFGKLAYQPDSLTACPPRL